MGRRSTIHRTLSKNVILNGFIPISHLNIRSRLLAPFYGEWTSQLGGKQTCHAFIFYNLPLSAYKFLTLPNYMGSFLTITNNTANEWQCNLTNDVLALRIGYLVVAGLAAVLGLMGTAASYTPGIYQISKATTAPELIRFVTNARIIEMTGMISGPLLGAASLGLYVHMSIQLELAKRGFIVIPSNQSHQWSKWTPHMWQQATCVRNYYYNTTTVRTETLLMRPIFTGGLIHRNKDYNIESWIKKRGVKTDDVVALVELVKASQNHSFVRETVPTSSLGSLHSASPFEYSATLPASQENPVGASNSFHI